MANTVQYGMVIDTTRCMGCQTCVVSCKVSNHTPEGLYWGRVRSLDGEVVYQPTGTFPEVKLAFRAELCNHCATPLCFANCPTGAIAKREEDGAVVVDDEVCIGCGTCAKACPYEIPQIDEAAKKASKCDLCYRKVAVGGTPWCVESCPGEARIFGDLNDPGSDVAKYIVDRKATQLHEDFGTGPSVYYVV
ncbi:4Fe-4S dicluster domain-containing protein [Gordonibacter sp.]|uniref:4Fe-4S dicluster domain-containing protein n=1 Tax=Gordonibacter sp. TaxID=1968902 RepID=UPI002FCABBE1